MATMIDEVKSASGAQTASAASKARPILAGATAAARLEARGHVARIVPFTHLYRHSFEIEALNRAALDPNPAYHPSVIAAHAMASGLAPRLRLVLVHDSGGVLRGFAPLVMRRLGGVFRLARALLVPGVDDSTPLIDAAIPTAAAALVEGVAELGGARFDRVTTGGRTAMALTMAAAGSPGMKAMATGAGDRMALDCRDRKAIKARLDTDYRKDLAAARRSLAHRFGRQGMQRLTAGAEFAAGFAEFRSFLRDGARLGGLEGLARAQEDDACLVLHRMWAGNRALGYALGLVAGRRYAGLAVGFDRSAEAPTVPPVFSVMLAEALAADPSIDRATGGAAFVTPSWQAEPVATIMVGASMQVEAERALGGLRRLMREHHLAG